MTPQEAGQTRHALTKLLIRLNRLNYRLDQHLTGEEIRNLQEERLRINAELFRVSVSLRGEHSLSESEVAELQGRGSQDEKLLGFLIRSMSAGQDSGEDKEELAERERVITARKEKIESQMEAITSSRQPAKRLSPDEMAKLRKERDGLRADVEDLLETRDFYLERVDEMRALARRGKTDRIYETLSRLERHTTELLAIASLRLIADLFTNSEPVPATRALELARRSDNDVFLQLLLIHHGALADDEGSVMKALLDTVLRKPATFRAELLEDTVSFFRSKTFRRDRSLHSVVLFNPAAPVHLLRHILRVSLRDLQQATERARANYGSSDILDVLTEIARTTSDRGRLRHILQITAVDPIRRVRFERVLGYRSDIGEAGVLELRPSSGS